MSDTKKTSKPSNPATTKRQKKTSGTTRSRKKIAKTSGDLLGLFLFAFGLGAICGVAYLGYSYFTGAPKTPQTVETEMSAASTTLQQQNTSKAKEDKSYRINTNIKQLKKSKHEDFIGQWRAYDGEKSAFIKFTEQTFFIIYQKSQKEKTQYYSGGYYKYDEDTGILTLSPHSSAPEPPARPGIRYRKLTARTYDVFMIKDIKQNAIIWKPHIPEGRSRHHQHPLIDRMAMARGYLGWFPSK